MSEHGTRHNTDKPKLSLVLEFSYALVGWTKALMYGMNKYSRGNWRKGFNHTEIADSALRHLNAWQSGEDIDPESGLKHVDMFLCNAGFLAEMVHTRPDLDDRPIQFKQFRQTQFEGCEVMPEEYDLLLAKEYEDRQAEKETLPDEEFENEVRRSDM